MISLADMPDMEPIYTFVSHSGENIHVASERLRQWCLENKPEIFWAPIERAIADTFVADNIISQLRANQLVFELLEKGELEPVIFCKVPGGAADRPDVILVDGHHRYYVQRHIGWTRAHILDEAQWRPFVVEGLQDLTKKQLTDMKVRTRDYWERNEDE